MIIELDKIEKDFTLELNACKKRIKTTDSEELKAELENRMADITNQLSLIMEEREVNFDKYYRLSFLFMKVAIYTLGQTHDYCHSSRRGLKHSLSVAAKGIESRIQDIALFLKAEYWRNLQDDINSDCFPAIGNVINEYAVCANLLDIEDDIISEIRKRKIEHEQLEAA